MISMPNGGSKEIPDVYLARYACYLVAQNGDPRKTEIYLRQQMKSHNSANSFARVGVITDLSMNYLQV